jgi:hypothetical protein
MTIEELSEINSDAIQADGWDKAFIGYVERAGQLPTACYDRQKIIELSIEDGMSEEDAIEYFEFNINGAYVGEFTPFYLTT